MARSVNMLATHLRHFSMMSCSPLTLRYDSYCPANDASAESSVVADERTATSTPGAYISQSFPYSVAIADLMLSGTGVSRTNDRARAARLFKFR